MDNTTTRSARKFDRLASTLTVWASLSALVAASLATGYVPTIRHPGLRAAVLAAGGRAWA